MTDGRIVLITGCSAGIGASTAQLFNKVGWRVVGVDCEKPVDEIEAAIETFYKVDLGNTEDIQVLARTFNDNYDSLHALVNNAAVTEKHYDGIENTDVTEYERVMNINLRAPWLLCKYFKPVLEKTGDSSIVNISSTHAYRAGANRSIYCASKGGIASMSRALSVELSPSRIRVNWVSPGPTQTPMFYQHMQKSKRPSEKGSIEKMVAISESRSSIGRMCYPQDVAEAILFLADSNKSAYITGTELVVDGGRHSKE